MLSALSKILQGLLVIFMAIALPFSFVIISMLIFPEAFPAADDKQYEWITVLIAVTMISLNVTFFAIVIIFLSWIYMTYKKFSAQQSLTFSPGWAIAWFLIPFANMVMPYFVMREASRKIHAERNRIVVIWWFFWLLTFIIPVLLMALGFIYSETIYYPVLAVAIIELLFAVQSPILIKIIRESEADSV